MTALMLAALLSPAMMPAADAAEAGSRPNVLLLIADDLNDYGFDHRYPGVQTPHLDRFRQSAITFTHAYCASPVCGPSRAAMFSGLYPHTTGAYFNGGNPWRQPPLAQTESLPELFRRSGYETFGRGKLFHAPISPDKRRNAWDNRPWGGGFGPFPPPADQLLGKFWGCTAWTGPDTDFPDVKNARAVIEFLRQPHAKPFFAVLGLWRPHTPFTAPKRFFDLYEPAALPLPPPGYRPDDLADVPAAGRSLSRIWGERWDRTGASNPGAWRRLLHGYLAATSFADWTVGRVLDALDRSPHGSHTLVIFWSDNGYHLGEKNHFEKATLWEQATLTPLAIRLPGRRHAGARCTRPVGAIDFYPTLIELCRLKSPGHSPEGTSLRPLLDDPGAPWGRPAISSYGPHVFSARSEQFRYIRYPDGSEELYDHDTDPHEFKNLAADPTYSSVKEQLRQGLPATWAKSLGGRKG